MKKIRESLLVDNYRRTAALTLYAKWITIGAGSGHKGTHVKVDSNGQIVTGPSDIKNRNIQNLSTHSKPPEYKKPELHRDHRSAIEDYTGGAFLDMNRALRKQGGIAAISNKKIQLQAKHISDAIQKHGISGLQVYRGVDIPKGGDSALIRNFERAAKVKGVVNLSGFQSTTSDPKIAESFAGDRGGDLHLVMKIKAKKGLPISTYGFAEEKEVLLDHGGRYRVTGFQKSRGRYTVELEEL